MLLLLLLRRRPRRHGSCAEGGAILGACGAAAARGGGRGAGAAYSCPRKVKASRQAAQLGQASEIAQGDARRVAHAHVAHCRQGKREQD